MSVHKKLMEARLRLQNSPLKKSGLNKFAGYQYFELGDFLPTVMTIFNEIGLCGVISFGTELAKLTITDVDASMNNEIVIESPMAEASLKGCHPIQNLGASQTYLRRYLWVTAMEIVEHDALDATTGSDKKAITPLTGAWEAMDEESQKFLQGIALDVIDLFDESGIEIAVKRLNAQILDNDEKAALWTRFDSKLRSAIKKFNAENKEK
jgi:hypothetical protein